MEKLKVAYRSDQMLKVLWSARDGGIWQDHHLDIIGLTAVRSQCALVASSGVMDAWSKAIF